jgi:hypothetical protein
VAASVSHRSSFGVGYTNDVEIVMGATRTTITSNVFVCEGYSYAHYHRDDQGYNYYSLHFSISSKFCLKLTSFTGLFAAARPRLRPLQQNQLNPDNFLHQAPPFSPCRYFAPENIILG